MSKEAVFTMKLEPELRAEFMAEAEVLDQLRQQLLPNHQHFSTPQQEA